jgi:hypothetical protein
MKKQQYSNHLRWYAPHHFVFYPVVIFFFAWSIRAACTHPDKRLEFTFIAVIFFLIAALSFMLRQHYALGNQNRIVRLEMRLRYYQLTNTHFETIEHQLTFGQIAALRFASDAELTALVQRTLSEHLSPSAIKQSIKDWQADEMRA